jgi:hypothetical protein
MFVALGIQHAMRIRHTVICDLSRSPVFFHIIPPKKKGKIFREKLMNLKCNILIF